MTPRPRHLKLNGIIGAWVERAACAGKPTVLFFPPDQEGRGWHSHGWTPEAAKAVCAECPCAKECLAYAQLHEVDHGVWGGHTPQERRRLKRPRTRSNHHEAREGSGSERVPVTPANPDPLPSRRRCATCGGFVSPDNRCRQCAMWRTEETT